MLEVGRTKYNPAGDIVPIWELDRIDWKFREWNVITLSSIGSLFKSLIVMLRLWCSEFLAASSKYRVHASQDDRPFLSLAAHFVHASELRISRFSVT